MKRLCSMIPCAATLALLAGGAMADTRPTLQSLQDQLNNTYTRQQVDNLLRKADPACADNGNRYVDCNNGTVTDTVTGVIWLKQANCLGPADYATANALAVALQAGQCGLTDHSKAGDWHLPTEAEWRDTLYSPVLDCRLPNLTNTAGTGCFSDGPQPFSGVLSDVYWSSSTQVDTPSTAWSVDLHYNEETSDMLTGHSSYAAVAKSQTHLAWPVRVGLTASALPSSEIPTVRSQVYEGIVLGDGGRAAVADYWMNTGFAPANNTQVGWPSQSGYYVTQTLIVNGRIDITYGNFANPAITGKVLSLTPYVNNSMSIVVWRCGNASAPTGLELLGTGTTGPVAVYQASTVDNKYLPATCRP